MDSLVPTLFHEIYRKCFGMAYDMTQESTWCWLTSQHIQDFYVPAYTRDDLPGMCIALREEHRPKMFLWMIEEYNFILSHLRVNDHNRLMVLGHELLHLACSRCCRKKRGPGFMPHGPNSLDQLPTCTLKTLECVVQATDTIQLECLAWAVFDNVMGPGKTPQISGFKTYGQILRHLVDKAYKGLHMHCPACTSALFGVETTTIKSRPGGPEPQKPEKPEHYSMMRDMRKEFVGSYSTFKDKQDSMGGDKVSGEVVQTADPNIHAMKWKKECQHSYMDAQLDFWLLLRPLTDGGEESS